MNPQQDPYIVDRTLNPGEKISRIIRRIVVTFGLLFFPGGILATILYRVLYKVKNWGMFMNNLFVLSYFSLFFIISIVWHPIKWLLNDLSLIRFIVVYLHISIFVGVMIYWLGITQYIVEMKRRPHVAFARGFHDGYRPAKTIFEKIKRENMVKKAKEGSYYSKKGAPLGIMEGESYISKAKGFFTKPSVVRKYYTESVTHCVITGGTGSGKPLHKSTLVPLPTGDFIPLHKIKKGDYVLDENFNPTKVLEKYRPYVEKAFEILFECGERVICGEEHLWQLDDDRILETKKIKYEMEKGHEITLYPTTREENAFEESETALNPMRRRIKEIKEVKRDGKDFYCLTVENKSHLFLITKSYLPTHNTVSILNQVYNDILCAKPIIYVDCKAASDVSYKLGKWAKENDRPFYHFSSGLQSNYHHPYNEEKACYDPLVGGDSTFKAELMLSLGGERKGDAEVYKQTERSILQVIFSLIDKVNRNDLPQIPWDEGGLVTLKAALEAKNLEAMIHSYSNDLCAKYQTADGSHAIIPPHEQQILDGATGILMSITGKSDDKMLRSQVRNVTNRVNGLLASSYGYWLRKSSSSHFINLSELAVDEKGPVVLFSLSTLSDADFAKYIGSMIIQDLSQVSAMKERQHMKGFTSLYFDEVQTLDVPAIERLLAKARSARIGTTLSLQSLEQIMNEGYPESLVSSILETCSSFIIHAGATKNSARRYCDIVGSRKRITGRYSGTINAGFFSFNFFNELNRGVIEDEEDKEILQIDQLQGLENPEEENGFRSTAYYITKRCADPIFKGAEKPVARKVLVAVPEEIVEPIPDDFMKHQVISPIGGNVVEEGRVIEIGIEPGKGVSDENWKIEETGIPTRKWKKMNQRKKIPKRNIKNETKISPEKPSVKSNELSPMAKRYLERTKKSKKK